MYSGGSGLSVDIHFVCFNLPFTLTYYTINTFQPPSSIHRETVYALWVVTCRDGIHVRRLLYSFTQYCRCTLQADAHYRPLLRLNCIFVPLITTLCTCMVIIGVILLILVAGNNELPVVLLRSDVLAITLTIC